MVMCCILLVRKPAPTHLCHLTFALRVAFLIRCMEVSHCYFTGGANILMARLLRCRLNNIVDGNALVICANGRRMMACVEFDKGFPKADTCYETCKLCRKMPAIKNEICHAETGSPYARRG